MRLNTLSATSSDRLKQRPRTGLRSASAITLLLACLSLGVGLSACATKHKLKPTNASISPIEKNGLSSDFIYKYLVGEVAGQRGELATSGTIFYELAKTERDPRLAERAAKIAVYANIPSLAIPAVKLWSELDPSSIEAQQAVSEMLIATGKLKDTESYLARLLVKEETRAGGFLYLNVLLSRSSDKAGVLRLVQSLAKPYPKLAEAHFAIAQSAWSAGQNDIALEALNIAESLKPGWSIAALLKGQILFGKSPQVALDFYQNFIKQNPAANEVRINMAKLLVSQKRYAEAKKEYPLIIKNANKSPDVSAILGLLSYQSSDYVAAESYFQQALDLDFKDVDQLYIYLAQTAEKLNHDDAALSWYSKIQSGTRYLEAQVNLANVIARTQSVDKAIDKLDALEDLNAEQQIIVIQTQAGLLGKAKRNQEAFDLLDKAVTNLPNTAELVYDYALAAERLQKYDILESELRKAIKAKPDFAAAYNALGYSFADRNIRLDEAVKLIEKALSISPNDHYILDSLGWAYYRKGNLDKAVEYLQQAYNANADPEIAAHLGEVLWQKGQREQATKIWRDALIANPENEVLLAISKKFKS
jgi:tetratricopeptide (TPR) repeat protein